MKSPPFRDRFTAGVSDRSYALELLQVRGAHQCLHSGHRRLASLRGRRLQFDVSGRSRGGARPTGVIFHRPEKIVRRIGYALYKVIRKRKRTNVRR